MGEQGHSLGAKGQMNPHMCLLWPTQFLKSDKKKKSDTDPQFLAFFETGMGGGGTFPPGAVLQAPIVPGAPGPLLSFM